jgi:hypothetical protein
MEPQRRPGRSFVDALQSETRGHVHVARWRNDRGQFELRVELHAVKLCHLYWQIIARAVAVGAAFARRRLVVLAITPVVVVMTVASDCCHPISRQFVAARGCARLMATTSHDRMQQQRGGQQI